MATTEQEFETEIEQRMDELEREELELGQRTDRYQWNHVVSLAASLVAVGLALIALLVAVLGNKSGSSSSSSVAQTPAAPVANTGGGSAAGAASPAPAKAITMSVKPDSKLGSDGNRHDSFLPTADLSVKAGQTVRVTIYNYDDAPHSFTSPGLAAGAAIPVAMQQSQGMPQDLKVMPLRGVGVDVNLPGGSHGRPSKTTFTFTAPKKAGEYVFYCKVPCDPWAMARFGYLMGHIKVAATSA